ncbi:hypothetical protein ACPESL_08155 [Psychrobacter pocilloporae]|uniref:hypothetical protein n=1 Tax=Psychrobacter pocilloporae TaxID=1775882 RepID=UPI003C2DB475
MSNPKITISDLEGLPDELVKQLKISKSFRLSWQIIRCMKENNGKISIDKLLVAYYHKHKEVLDRQKVNAKLYRMVQQELIIATDGAKGVYELTKKSKEGLTDD